MNGILDGLLDVSLFHSKPPKHFFSKPFLNVIIQRQRYFAQLDNL